MASGRKKRLETTIAAINQRWGPGVIRRIRHDAAESKVPCISTGFQALDGALGIGGIPRGRITEILGVPTSGMSTLSLKLISSVQNSGGTAVYIDLARTFDPDFAARCNVQVDRLYLVRPHTAKESLEMALALVRSDAVRILVFDAVTHLLREPLRPQDTAALLRQINSALQDSRCALVFLTPLHFGNSDSPDNYPDGFTLPAYATVRLLIKKETWIPKRYDIHGYRARVSILKNKLGASGKSSIIEITFDGVVQGNGT